MEWYDSIRRIFQNSWKYHFDFEIVHSNQSIKKIMRKKTKERENPFREWLIFCNRRGINTSFLSLSFSVKKIELVGTRINEMDFVFWWRWFQFESVLKNPFHWYLSNPISKNHFFNYFFNYTHYNLLFVKKLLCTKNRSILYI